MARLRQALGALAGLFLAYLWALIVFVDLLHSPELRALTFVAGVTLTWWLAGRRSTPP